MLDFLTNSAAYIIPFVILLSVVALFHEMGHFLVGRWCGVKVDIFSIGFGPELYARKDRRGTRWRIAAIPLGGFVKFHGDADIASAADSSARATTPAAERAGSFSAQPLAKRAAIIFGGPLANFILAIAILAGALSFYGHTVVGPRIGKVVVGSVAEEAGFKAGDLVMSINGQPVSTFTKIMEAAATDAPLRFVVRRADRNVVELTATPSLREIEGPTGKMHVRLGVHASTDPSDLHHEPYGVAESLGLALSSTWQITRVTGTYVAALVSGRESADQLGGPIGIAQISHESAQKTLDAGLIPFLNLIAMFSVSVGMFNLLPVPLLDGGHLAFMAMEAVRGRPVSRRFQEFGLRCGLAMVSMLLILSTYNDIARLVR
jgi:regulator of sigma E protease